jgi:hypothetical protein
LILREFLGHKVAFPLGATALSSTFDAEARFVDRHAFQVRKPDRIFSGAGVGAGGQIVIDHVVADEVVVLRGTHCSAGV